MNFSIALVPGDGVGPDVVREAARALSAVGKRFSHGFTFTEAPAGGGAFDACGVPLPPSTVETCRGSDAVLLGAVGGPAWDSLPGNLRPERALLGLRAALGVFANLRPAAVFPQLRAACPLKDGVVPERGFDLLIVRELTGGIYFGERGRSPDGSRAWDTEAYSAREIDRLLAVAFESALKRRGRLCVVDKANVLESSRLWRERAEALRPSYPGVELSFMYVDNAAMQLVRAPARFDVIAASNMFGDILSDEASQLTGSIGMLASASLGSGGPGLYEPIHGSAPDIAGTDAANPLAAILSAALLLRYSLRLPREADAVERAVGAVLDAGWRTADIAGGDADALRAAGKLAGTRRMGELVAEAIGAGAGGAGAA